MGEVISKDEHLDTCPEPVAVVKKKEGGQSPGLLEIESNLVSEMLTDDPNACFGKFAAFGRILEGILSGHVKRKEADEEVARENEEKMRDEREDRDREVKELQREIVELTARCLKSEEARRNLELEHAKCVMKNAKSPERMKVDHRSEKVGKDKLKEKDEQIKKLNRQMKDMETTFKLRLQHEKVQHEAKMRSTKAGAGKAKPEVKENMQRTLQREATEADLKGDGGDCKESVRVSQQQPIRLKTEERGAMTPFRRNVSSSNLVWTSRLRTPRLDSSRRDLHLVSP
jgi:hypothetical protein